MARKKKKTDDPNYTAFANRSHKGNYHDEEEKRLRQGWEAWKKNKKKIWYL